MTNAAAGRRLLLVRHTAVADAWRSRCYGATDVPLGEAGRSNAHVLAQELAVWRPSIVFSSPLRRARFLAALIARRTGARLQIDARLSERNFGAWEGRSWDDIYGETGDAMMGMLQAPDSFRPGGGETTAELRDRVLSWQCELPAGVSIVAVCHGGPIAAMLGTARELSPDRWADLIPPPGGSVEATA
jgi:broad specificity phosphatase PhoE